MTKLRMAKPKVALMTFGDERDYMWEGYFGGLSEPHHKKAVEYLRTLPIEIISFKDAARSKQIVDQQVKELKAAGA